MPGVQVAVDERAVVADLHRHGSPPSARWCQEPALRCQRGSPDSPMLHSPSVTEKEERSRVDQLLALLSLFGLYGLVTVGLAVIFAATGS